MFEIGSACPSNKRRDTDSGGRDSAGLRVRISKSGDRFIQQILWVTGAREQLLLESVEGDDANNAPPSPPIQDLSVEKRSDREVALGVGMAGPSLWSLSIEAVQQQGRLIYDIACNHRQGPALPCSTYRAAYGQWTDQGLMFEAGGASWCLKILPVERSGNSASVKFEPASDSLEIQGTASSQTSETYRWGYEIQLRESVLTQGAI